MPEKRVIVEFVLRDISPDEDNHAEFLVQEYLRQKGVVNTGEIGSQEFYIYAKQSSVI
jgi:hypothetical protein